MASKLKSFVDGIECVQSQEGKEKGREHFAVGLFDGSTVVVVVVVAATTLTSVLRLTFAVSHFCNNSTTSLTLTPMPAPSAGTPPQLHSLLCVCVCTQQGGKLKCIRVVSVCGWIAGWLVADQASPPARCVCRWFRDETLCHYANYELDKRY